MAMDAAGFSVVDNRAGVTFGVELYVPWDGPEMATDLTAKGTVPLSDVQDVFGMCGRRKGATESRILQGRDACSVRVLVTGTTTPEGPLGNASPQVTHVSGKTDHSCARLRPPSERPLGNASPRVTHASGIIDDSCARLRPPSERPLGNAGPQVTHVSGKTDDSCARLWPPSERPLCNASPQVTHMSGITDYSCARLRPPSERPLGNAGPQVTHVSGKTDDSCARLRPPSERPLDNAGPQVTHVSGKTVDSCAKLRPPSDRPLGNASPQVTHMSGIADGLCARPMPPGRRQRSQRWIQNTATHVAPRLTEQDPRMAAGAVVFDCRPAVLPVSVDASGIDLQTVRRAEPPAESVVAPAKRKQEFRGWMTLIRSWK